MSAPGADGSLRPVHVREALPMLGEQPAAATHGSVSFNSFRGLWFVGLGAQMAVVGSPPDAPPGGPAVVLGQ
jgi:hypothetical protein